MKHCDLNYVNNEYIKNHRNYEYVLIGHLWITDIGPDLILIFIVFCTSQIVCNPI